MEISVRTQLGELAPQWDDLVLEMALPSPFLRSWWLDNAAIGEPQIVLCTDGDRLLGGVALQRSERFGSEWLEMLGDGPLEPDHLDLVAAPDAEAQVAAAIGGWLGRAGSRVLDFRGLTEGSALGALTPGRGSVRQTARAPFAVLPSEFATYLANRPGRFRSTAKRSKKRLLKDGYELRVAAPSDCDRALEALRTVHEARWGDGSGFVAGWDRFAAVARAAVVAGDAEISELVGADGTVVASEIDFKVGDRLSYYQSGRIETRDLRGSGTVLRADIVERGIEAGYVEFDLLRGEELYKIDWVNGSRRLVEIRRGVGPKGLALMAVAEGNYVFQQQRVRLNAAIAARREAEAESDEEPSGG
jgi:CelD/BcsL family acetyltransferase involved in cellulose biosynthesis